MAGERDSYREISPAISTDCRIEIQTYPQMYPQSNGAGHDSGGQGLVVWMRCGEDAPSRFALAAVSGCKCFQRGRDGLSATPLDSPTQTQLCNSRCWQLFPLNSGLVEGSHERDDTPLPVRVAAEIPQYLPSNQIILPDFRIVVRPLPHCETSDGFCSFTGRKN